MRNHSDIISRRRAPRLSIALALALAGCAPHSSELGPGPEPAQLAQPTPPQAERSTCRPATALLAPQSAPDCAFNQPHLKTIDPAQWARLKVEYEITCYQRAEKAVRERLRLLQTANRCEFASLAAQ